MIRFGCHGSKRLCDETRVDAESHIQHDAGTGLVGSPPRPVAPNLFVHSGTIAFMSLLRILLTIFLLASFSHADIPITGKADPALAPFDDLFKAFLAEHDVPGAAVAVAKDGKLVYARGFGYADRENKSPAEPDNLFRIASISKPVTAVAILQLVEQGKLKLDDRPFQMLRVEPFLEDGAKVDPRMKDITILHLLQHTGGFDRGVSFDPMFKSVEFSQKLGTKPPAGPHEVMRVMMGRTLDHDPGTNYAYSNYGYAVLGRVIEKVTGQNYDAYVKEHVLKPVGVTRMRIGATLSDGRADGEVKYYMQKPTLASSVFPDHNGNTGEKVPWPYGGWHLEAMDSHGGWIASAPDLVRFACTFNDLDRSPLLKGASIETMFASPNLKDSKPDVWYGCGWSVRVVGPGKINTWHSGALAGTSTILVRRHDGLTWAVHEDGGCP